MTSGKSAASCIANRLAIIEAFECSQLIDLFFNQVGQAMDESTTIARIHTTPRTGLESSSSGFGGQIDVGSVTFSYFSDRFLRFAGLTVENVLPLTEGRHFPTNENTLYDELWARGELLLQLP